MRPVRTVAEIRAAEAAHQAELASGVLMERAAFGLAMRCCGLLRAMRGRVAGARVLVLAGSGGNGGDALVAGARLAERGCRVDVIAASDRLHERGLVACTRAGALMRAVEDAAGLMAEADLVLDGMVGIGATGPLRPPLAALADLTRDTAAVVVAVDVPSGVDADTGRVAGSAVHADVTVTFAALKPGLLTGAGRQCARASTVVDIGISDAFPPPRISLVDEADVAAWLPAPSPQAHKVSRGVVGLASGSDAYPGAGELVAAAAASGITGMVMSLRPCAIAEVVRVPSVAEAGRVTAWTCGSGWPTGAGARDAALLQDLVATDVPLVLDAGAALALGEDADLRRAVRERPAPTVITPHEGEFRRLHGEELDDRIAAARDAAARLGVIVLLKGPGTVIADPDGRVLVDDLGGPELAVAGSGDLLAGILGAVLSTGVPAFEAAGVATWLHSAAGSLAATDGAPVSASAILAALPDAVRWGRQGPASTDPARMGR